YLGIDELSESREELDRLDREASRVDPIGEAPLELAEIRVQVTRELKRDWRAGAPVRHRSRGPRHPPERFRESARPEPRWLGGSSDAFPAPLSTARAKARSRSNRRAPEPHSEPSSRLRAFASGCNPRSAPRSPPTLPSRSRDPQARRAR